MKRGMFPRSAAPRGRPGHYNGPTPPNHAAPYHDYNRRVVDGFNSFHAPGPKWLPRYEWKPTPPGPPVPPPPLLPPPLPPPPPHRNPSATARRKRHRDNFGPDGVKRQRLESSSQASIDSPPLFFPAVAGPSRQSDLSCPSPQSHPQPQWPAIGESPKDLQSYAKDKLSEQMVSMFEACQQQSSDLYRKEMCRSRLQEDIQYIFKVARLYLTGSSMSGLACRSSDADLCLVLEEKKRPDPIHVLSVLKRLFKSLPYVEKTQLIRAKVPILRFREKGSDLEFDLNVNNTVGIRNTFLLKTYAYADLRIRPIILVVKKWARHTEINNASKGTLSSYTLVLMILHYLQTLSKPVLPSLQRDYPECFDPSLEVDMVPEGPKHIPPFISRNESSLGDLFLGFLKYYATDFRWDKQVISIREATALPKNNSAAWKNKYICVEEPFERNNVARAVHEQAKFEMIKAQFVKSWRMLQKWKDLNSILPVRMIINKESSRQ